MAENASTDNQPGAELSQSLITASIANVTSDPTKKPIPSDKLNEILLNEEYMKTLRPLIAKAVEQASSIQSLRDAITKLFEEKTNDNKELAKALTALQKKLQSIYEGKEPRAKSEGGARKRKSKKRNYYKKRRTSKYR
jgi:hypothetical protein